MNFKPYTPPNEGAGLLTVDRDLCWRINLRGLVTPAVIGAVCWARNNFPMSDAQHQVILDGLGLEYHRLPNTASTLRPKEAYLRRLGPKPAAQNFSLFQPQLPLCDYDAIEIYPCVESESGIERFEANEHPTCAQPAFWSVALHLEAGHIETIADFPAQAQAEAFGSVMSDLVRAARQDQGLDITHL
ncbi:MAG: hypothetical protein Q7K57_00770 [Burkholderiaceae bacterium]|nr:hypothetical protein [Polaromonas sp.]MDO8767249.1 hypothetical protein [Burkholderiaceae bacterium]